MLDLWKKRLFFINDQNNQILKKCVPSSVESRVPYPFSSSLSTKHQNLDGGILHFLISLLSEDMIVKLFVEKCNANICIRDNHCRIP